MHTDTAIPIDLPDETYKSDIVKQTRLTHTNTDITLTHTDSISTISVKPLEKVDVLEIVGNVIVAMTASVCAKERISRCTGRRRSWFIRGRRTRKISRVTIWCLRGCFRHFDDDEWEEGGEVFAQTILRRRGEESEWQARERHASASLCQRVVG